MADLAHAVALARPEQRLFATAQPAERLLLLGAGQLLRRRAPALRALARPKEPIGKGARAARPERRDVGPQHEVRNERVQLRVRVALDAPERWVAQRRGERHLALGRGRGGVAARVGRGRHHALFVEPHSAAAVVNEVADAVAHHVRVRAIIARQESHVLLLILERPRHHVHERRHVVVAQRVAVHGHRSLNICSASLNCESTHRYSHRLAC